VTIKKNLHVSHVLLSHIVMPFVVGHGYALAQAQPATAAGVGLVALWPGAVRHRMGACPAMGVYRVGSLADDKRLFFSSHGIAPLISLVCAPRMCAGISRLRLGIRMQPAFCTLAHRSIQTGTN
jgi:hypothetical protein